MAYPAAKSGFTLDDLTKLGPDEITRKRKIAEALLASSQGIHPIANPLEGMAQMAQALVGNLKLSRLDRAEREGKSDADALFGAGMGTGAFPAAPSGGSTASSAPNPNVADGPKGNESYPMADAGGDIAGYIRQAAQARGIDPEVALRVASSEGGLKDPFRQGDAMLDYGREESYGPFQLHMRQGGVGERALKAGIDPRKDWKAGIDYALDEAAQKGWGQWFGAKRVGVGNRAGLDQARALGVQPPTQVASLDPAAGMPPAANAMLPPQAGAPGQEAIAKALLGPTGYNPATNPANAQADAMMANPGGAPVPGSVALVPDAYGAIDPQKVPPINDAQTVVGQPPAAQVPLPAPPQAALPQQQQIGQALVAQNDPQNSMTLGAPPITAAGPDMRTLMGMAGNEFMSPQQQKMIEALTGQRMQDASPEHQLDMEMKLAQLDKLKAGDQKDDVFAQRAKAAAQFGLDPNTQEGQNFILSGDLPASRGGAAELSLNTIPGVDKDGNPILIQVGKDGVGVQTKLPEGVRVQRPPMIKDTGTEFQVIDPTTREVVRTIPKNVAGAAAETEKGKAEGQAAFDLPRVEQNATQTLEILERMKNHPGREGSTGFFQGLLPSRSSDQVDFQSLVDQTQGQSFLQAFQSLKGGGQITETEGKKATEAISRLGNQRLSDDDYLNAIADLEDVVRRGLARAKQQAKASPTSDTPTTVDDTAELPEGVTEEDIQHTMKLHGVTREQVLEKLRAP